MVINLASDLENDGQKNSALSLFFTMFLSTISILLNGFTRFKLESSKKFSQKSNQTPNTKCDHSYTARETH